MEEENQQEAATTQQPKKRGRPKGAPNRKTSSEEFESITKMRDRVVTTGNNKKAVVAVDDKYSHWKSVVPILYDWLANHNLVWPSLSCRYVIVTLLNPSFMDILPHFFNFTQNLT